MAGSNVPLIAMIGPAKSPDLDAFLGQLLPAQGNYWLLMHRMGQRMMHESFDSVDGVAERIKALDAAGVEVWHAVASYTHHHDEFEHGGGERWGRKRGNVAYLAAFFLDIDVAPDKPGKAYSTIEEAEDAVAQFAGTFGEPYHYLVRSGSGLHVYWFLDADVPRDEWERVALKFKDASRVAALLADPTRTADPASVLRPVGATNRKPIYGMLGRTVEGAWCRFGRVSLDAFEAACDRVIGIGGQLPVAAGVARATLSPTQAPHWFDGLSERVKLHSLKSMLSVLPKEYVSDYGQWLSIGAALAGAEGLPRATLFELWSDWSQSTGEGAESWHNAPEHEHRRRWEGLTKSGVGALITRARAVGWLPDTLRDSAGGNASFLAVVAAQKASGERWTAAQAEAYLNEHIAFVKADNQYLLDGMPLTKEALDTSLARHMPVSSERQITASGLLKKGAGIVVDYIGYMPGAGRTFVDRDGRKIANVWRPYIVEPVKPSIEDAHTFVDFVKHLSGGNDETKAGIRRIFTKISFLFQNPSERVRHATLLIGKNEGCGKSTLTHAIPRALFGDANVRCVETRELSSDFNGYVQGARILVFPELWLGNRKDALTQANNLKPLITDDCIPVVKKGRDGRNMENYTTIFASSNHPDAAVFGDRDRRYDVISTDAAAMPLELASRVYSLITRRPGALLSLCLLCGNNADGFDPNAPPPQTGAKSRMMAATRAVWAERIHDAFEAHEPPFTGDAVAVSDVRRMLEREFDRPPSDNAIRDELLNMVDGAYSIQAQRRQGAGTLQKRVIVLRNASTWKDAGPSAIYEHYDEYVIRSEGKGA